MNDNLYKIILTLIPLIGAIITGYIIPYIKTKISSAKLDEASKWITKATEAAEMLFNAPKSGEEKRQYVIAFIDKMFNSKKEFITEEQIRVLLEAALKQMNKT